MNCSTQKLAELLHDRQANPKKDEQLRNDWENYLGNHPILSMSDRHRLALTEMMHLKSTQENRTLFHLTLTYKPYRDRLYQEADVNQFFTKFYTQHLLPYLLGTRRIHKKRSIQPICLAFIDEHELKPMKVLHTNAISNTSALYEFPARLHHHAILAVHPHNAKLMTNIVGTNTLATGDFSYKVMSSDLKECEAMRLLYASKMLKKYPDFLSFPDREN